MTKVVVDSGICGLLTTSTATIEADGKQIAITIATECEMVEKMSEDLVSLDKMSVFTGFLSNPVYISAAGCLKHTACPVPSGIIKAMEAEAGFCLPKDASIAFRK